MITSRGLGGAGGSSSDRGKGGYRSESPPRDPTTGKGPVVVEGTSREMPMERPEFIPATGSSGQMSITRGDFAEYVGEKVLARLLEKNPAVVAAVLTAREERRRAVELAQEEERLRRKAEELMRETEMAKRA